MYDYHETCGRFLEFNCRITDTKEEYEERNKGLKFKKCNYIAACGHPHIVFINVFISRKTGRICPTCKHTENSLKKKEEIKDNKLKNIKTELHCIDYFKSVCNFDIHKAFDGCKADLIVRPKGKHGNDQWIGIQVKSTERNNHYHFHLENNYFNLIILCICEEDKKMWLFPYEDIKSVSTLHIGLKSKYKKYEVKPDTIDFILQEYYAKTPKFTYEELDTPQSIYTQREKEFYRYRESKIDFLEFTYNEMEGLVYDFKIGNKKVQEKVGCYDSDKHCYIFGMHKNNGVNKGVRKFQSYQLGDNDLYWLNCDNKETFYVFPEDVLIYKNYIGYSGNKKQLKININPTTHNEWTKPYTFTYSCIDKKRLLDIIQS